MAKVVTVMAGRSKRWQRCCTRGGDSSTTCRWDGREFDGDNGGKIDGGAEKATTT